MCEFILLFHQFKVHSETGSSCWVICSYWPCLCLISVLLLLAAALWSVAWGTAFVSSHPLLYQPQSVLSQAVSLLSLRRVKLEAKLNRWAAVSREWNFSPTGFRKAELGGWGKDWREWGKICTKRLLWAEDKPLESHRDEAMTQVTGERAKAHTRSPSSAVAKELLFYRCGKVLFFLRDVGKPWNQSLPHANRKPFTISLPPNTE